jgi:hypothetical protein
MRRVLVLLSFAFVLVGCPEARPAPSQDAPCAQIGQRCRTPEGPLGVCNEQAGECASPPCLACIPQH